jgi:hypothetical protein
VTAAETLWAVGSYDDVRGVRTPWRISHEEIGRDVRAATAVLAELGVDGRRVLWCSMLAQAGQYWPYVCATVMVGARLSCADASYGEATRVSMFCRLMTYDAVFGVTEALLDGLDATGRSPADVFADVRLVGAHPGAYERLIEAGLAPVRVALCGPALAIAHEPGGPASVVADEWELVDVGDRIGITNLRPRAQSFHRTPIALRGTIVNGGIVPDAVSSRTATTTKEKRCPNAP